MLKWFYKIFMISFEEDEIIFKVKVRKKDQDYVWGKVTAYGYWKYSGDFLWNKLGCIYTAHGEGRHYEGLEQELLELAKLMFIKQSRKGIIKNTMRVPVSELIPLIDGKSLGESSSAAKGQMSR